VREVAVFLVLGTLAIISVLLDAFFVIAPRASRFNISWSRLIARFVWPPLRATALRVPDPVMRESILSAFAPAYLVMFLLVWLSVLVLGYGCLFFALRDHLHPVSNFGSAVYFGGITLLTIGYGDIVPTDGATRALAIFAGATGIGLFSVTTAYLFLMFSAYRRREPFVTIVGVRAGGPCSGLELVERYARVNKMERLSGFLAQGEQWVADVLDSHTAYPPLIFFRGATPGLSWVAVLVGLLDVSALLATTVRCGTIVEADLMIQMGRHTARSFPRYIDYPKIGQKPMERATFERGYKRLSDAGLELHPIDEAWKRFSEIRSTYITPLVSIAQYAALANGHWFTERSWHEAQLVTTGVEW
jgi:voltage-gated potassium channel Kch